jgi:hypothetical protein
MLLSPARTLLVPEIYRPNRNDQYVKKDRLLYAPVEHEVAIHPVIAGRRKEQRNHGRPAFI